MAVPSGAFDMEYTDEAQSGSSYTYSFWAGAIYSTALLWYMLYSCPEPHGILFQGLVQIELASLLLCFVVMTVCGWQRKRSTTSTVLAHILISIHWLHIHIWAPIRPLGSMCGSIFIHIDVALWCTVLLKPSFLWVLEIFAMVCNTLAYFIITDMGAAFLRDWSFNPEQVHERQLQITGWLQEEWASTVCITVAVCQISVVCMGSGCSGLRNPRASGRVVVPYSPQAQVPAQAAPPPQPMTFQQILPPVHAAPTTPGSAAPGGVVHAPQPVASTAVHSPQPALSSTDHPGTQSSGGRDTEEIAASGSSVRGFNNTRLQEEDEDSANLLEEPAASESGQQQVSEADRPGGDEIEQSDVSLSLLTGGFLSSSQSEGGAN
eukprot:TRINITY_DN34047_c0_g2_i1.p1 TRINITY_DN34047_c0_g2~~TRINITY_DN34047_c0_g2_i1.p1  ORF type:complete len:397 (+),score=41.18 TRINITY_DN34047_c0_g2_i1:61-1191(+)